MWILTRYPVARTLIFGLALISALLLVSGGHTLWLSSVLVGDAKAVNLAGSLRMQSYRIATHLQSGGHHHQLNQLLAEFDQRLQHPDLRGHVQQAPPPLGQQFSLVEHHFSRMKQAALSNPGDYLASVDGFVATIDDMVVQLQGWSEAKVEQLRQQQGIITLVGLLVAALFALMILQRLILPLKALLEAVHQMGQGRYQGRLHYRKADELGELSQAFDSMSQEISRAHTNMESTIAQQTHELVRKTQVLSFLFELNQALNQGESQLDYIQNWALKELKDILQAGQLQWLDTAPKHGSLAHTQVKEQVLHVEQSALAPWQAQVINTVVDLFNQAIERQQLAKNENRLALYNERAIIARELHDTLAQQLSYLKIQISRWSILYERGSGEKELKEVIGDIKAGLNSGYRRLRELLTTLRTTPDESGLIVAIQTALEELKSVAPNLQIDYLPDNQWPEQLAPGEELHCLYIVKEALANIIKHAHASQAWVRLQCQQQQLCIEVQDNGIGLPDAQHLSHQYGLTIMKERAERIGASLAISTPPQGGTLVRVTFIHEPN